MWVNTFPLSELSRAASCPRMARAPPRMAPLYKGAGAAGKASNPGVCFRGLVLIRFRMTALTFVLLLVELPTLRGNLFTFSKCRRVHGNRCSPQDSDAPEKQQREGRRTEAEKAGWCQNLSNWTESVM